MPSETTADKQYFPTVFESSAALQAKF